MKGRTRIQFVWVAILAIGGQLVGCASWPRRSVETNPAPTVFSQEPTLEDVIQVVNANSARVQQLQTTRASLIIPGIPPLSASWALERPQRFHLQASSLVGPELDLGSNDDTYWMWVKRNDPPRVYYGHHDQFYRSAARQILPVPPSWLAEALGIVSLDPYGRHDGPHRPLPGRLEVRSTIETPAGELTKITVIDDKRGWVLEQHIYNGQRQLLASAVATEHRFDAANAVSLPYRVQIKLPPSEMEFTLEVDQYSINQLYGDPLQMWAMPHFDGYPVVDLAGPGTPSYSQPPPSYRPTNAEVYPEIDRFPESRPRQALRRLPPRF